MGDYKTYIALFILSAITAWAFTPLSIRLALRLGAMDQPGGRKIHKHPTPRMGGLGLFVGFFLPWVTLYLVENPISAAFKDFEMFMLAMLFGAASMLISGVYDDIKGANAANKFSVQCATAAILWICGIRIDELAGPWGAPIELGWMSFPLSVLWLVGITNAINLLDGIDGLVAGLTVVMSISLAIINVLSNNILVALMTICLAGASVGFLPYNRTPARTFLGDSGSLTIGMMLACISVMSFFDEGRQSASPIISVPLILFALPLADTFRVMIRRLISGASMFKADRSHVHHRLLSLGLNQRQTVWALYLVSAGTGAFAVIMTRFEFGTQLIWSVILAAIGGGAYAVWQIRYRRRWLSPSKSDKSGE